MKVQINDQIHVDGLAFVCIGTACPEQYDVYHEESDDLCGYVKVRGGWLRCWYPDAGDDLIYEQQLEDLQGAFYKHEERMLHLTAIANAINQKIGK